MRDEIIKKILDNKIIAIIRGLDADQAVRAVSKTSR